MARAKYAIEIKKVSKEFVINRDVQASIRTKIGGLFTSGDDAKPKKQQVLKDIDLKIKEGEFFGIVGRNGSGKSTLLKIIANIYQPTKGRVVTNGKLVPFIELGVGFNPILTGRDNVYLNAAMLGFSRAETDAFYDKVVEFAELEDHMNKKLINYSSGMQVRLAFSIAIQAQGEILLIDEVLAVGDAAFQRKCFDYFRELKESKKTVIFISHSMEQVRRFCTRAAHIEDSKIIMVGDPMKVSDSYSDSLSQSVQDTWSKLSDKYKKSLAKVKTESVNIDENKVVIKQKLTVKPEMKGQKIDIGVRIFSMAGNLVASRSVFQASGKHLVVNKNQELEWSFDNAFPQGGYRIESFVADLTKGVDGADRLLYVDSPGKNIKIDREFPYAGVIVPGVSIKL